MRNSAVHQSVNVRRQDPKNYSDADTKCLVWGKGMIRIGDARMWGLLRFPSKLLRWKGGEGGLLAGITEYGCNREKGVNCNEDFPQIDFFLSLIFQEKESEAGHQLVGRCL